MKINSLLPKCVFSVLWICLFQALEGRQVEEAVSSLFHTLLFHRTLGKFHYKQEGNYCVGTVGYEDVDCNFIDLTYVLWKFIFKIIKWFYKMDNSFLWQVRCSSGEIDRLVHREASAFSECLRSRELETQGQARSGHISLTFYQMKKARWPFPSESIPWEVWNLSMEIVSLASESGELLISQFAKYL